MLCFFASPAEIAAQTDTTIVAGARYDAGPIGRLLLGSGYRDLWTTPIEVPVLKPSTFLGGLILLQRGGGLQTASLRFAAPDGHQYVFRSVDKNQDGGLHPDLQRTLTSWIAQDQVSAKHPAGARVAASLLDEAGVLRASPRLMVMADDPGLGEHREEFAGMLGILEEYAEDVEDGGAGFGGYPRIIGSERMLERLVESTDDRVDAEAYARARLVDILIGDWDRHPDQWRWGAPDRDRRRRWVPIPRDRDNAFADVGGLVAMVAGVLRSNITSFDETYSDLYAYLHNAQPLDRRILPELEWEDWSAIAVDLSGRLTDTVIDAAVDSLPPEYQSIGGEALAAKLKARRSALPGLAREVYRTFATEVDVHATDVEDVAEVVHEADGGVTVALRDGDSGGPAYFERRANATDTREVRIFLGDGDDVVIIRGTAAPQITVRVMGGEGDDLVADSVRVRGGERTLFFDDAGQNRRVGTRSVEFHDDRYEVPASDAIAENNAPPPRDWGRSFSVLVPWVGWESTVGPIVGIGPSWTRYGFRRVPFASKAEIRVEYAPLHTRFGIEARSRYVRTGNKGETRVGLRATDISFTRFHGFGNETAEDPGSDWTSVWAREIGGEIEFESRLSAGATVYIGPDVTHLDPEPTPASPAALPGLPGGSASGIGGLTAGGDLDGRDASEFTRRGYRLQFEGAGYPFVWGDGASEPFLTGRAVASVYLPLPLPLETTLAVRAGGAGASDGAPIQHAAFLGGGSSLRGYSPQRFAGDAAAFAGAEVRTLLGRANLLVARGDLGILGFVDAGRVWYDGIESDKLHTGYGGGVWFAPFERTLTFHGLYEYGDEHRFSVGVGLPF